MNLGESTESFNLNAMKLDIRIDGSPAEMIMSLYSPLSAESGKIEDVKSPEDVPVRPSPMIVVKEAAPILSPFVCQEEDTNGNDQHVDTTVKNNAQIDEIGKNGD